MNAPLPAAFRLAPPVGVRRPAANVRDELRVESRVQPIRADWEELAARVGAAPFLQPGWLAAWWHAFGEGSLELVTLRRGGELAALLPIVRRHGELRSAMNCHTPQFELLADDDTAALAVARHLFVGRPRRVAIASLAEAGASLGALRRAAVEAGYRVRERSFQRSPYIPLAGSWGTYREGLSRNLSADLRRSRRRLEAMGRVEFDVADGGERLPVLLREAFAIEASSWKGVHGTAIQSHRDTLSFYARVAHWAAAAGTLRLFFLRCEGSPLAMFVALEQDGVCHLVKGGYDPSFGRYSPGKLLLEAVVRRGYRTGLARIELHGGAERYKLRWTRHVCERVLFEAYSPSPAGRCLFGLAMLRAAARRLLERTRARGAADESTNPAAEDHLEETTP